MFFDKNKICFLIPARGGSKAIKYKNLKKINGKSLVEISINFALKFVSNKNICLSSDNEKILKIGTLKNINILKRPKYLSHGRVSDIDLILPTLKIIKKKKFKFKIFSLLAANFAYS